jgi:hypothetical protein
MGEYFTIFWGYYDPLKERKLHDEHLGTTS